MGGRTMTDVKLRIRVAEDRNTVEVEISPRGKPTRPVALNLDQLTMLIDCLGKARRQMVQGQPVPDICTQTIRIALGTKWHIEFPPGKDCLIAFYHLDFGP